MGAAGGFPAWSRLNRHTIKGFAMMTVEKLLKFRLTDLKTVRIVCCSPKCNGVIEIPIDDLKMHMDAMQRCQFCGSNYSTEFGGADKDLLKHFGKCVAELAACTKFAIEFPLQMPLQEKS
jgi:hypothetical protein